MNSSRDDVDSLLPDCCAPQHGRAPRPLPLFLELVRQVSARDPQLAADALAGLRAYERAPRERREGARPEIMRVGGASLRDHGGSGRPVVMVPSLINPPRILDLDAEVSLAGAIAGMGRRALLLDWGPVEQRAELSVAGHVGGLLVPMLRAVGTPAALVGYCLGGTMSMAAAQLTDVERIVTIAAPWHFAAYPDASRTALNAMWHTARAAAQELGALPMEVLQAAFWSLDPDRTVGKFAEFGRLDPQTREARRFVELEQWANEGEALPLPAARELIEDLFGRDLPGNGEWSVGGTRITGSAAVPALHLVAKRDRIAPAATAPAGEQIEIDSGHVGMIVGSARHRLHRAIEAFLAPCR